MSAAAPVIAMLKSIVIFFIATVIAYAGILMWLKTRITDRRKFWLYKQLIGLAALLVMAAYVFFRTGHQ